MINERDAICTTESKGVVGFKAIALWAAFHAWDTAACEAGESKKPGA